MSFAYISMALKLMFLNIQHIYGKDLCYRALLLVAFTYKETSSIKKEMNMETNSIKKEINIETNSIKKNKT